MTAPRVAALDLSLTRSGIALPDGRVVVLRPKTRGCERMQEIRGAVLAYAGAVQHADHLGPDERQGWWPRADLAAIEGFAFGARGRAVFDIGGLGWVVRVALHEAGVRYVEVPPATLKKYATGRGNADKQAMQMAAVKRLGYDDDSPDDNAIDALWLRALALDAYGHPVAAIPKAQRDAAVRAVDWPTLGEVAAA